MHSSEPFRDRSQLADINHRWPSKDFDVILTVHAAMSLNVANRHQDRAWVFHLRPPGLAVCGMTKIMADKAFRVSHDWVGNARISLLAWWIPKAAIIVALLAPVPLRTAIWSTALLCMGIACILNARRCGRTHCLYTGPFYLGMAAPTTLLASSAISANIYGWVALALFIIAGGWVIRWATEQAWG